MSDQQILNALINFFEEDDWHFHFMEDLPVLSMSFTGRNGKWTCYAQAREEQEQFVFYSVCPVNAPPERQNAVMEFITRANYGMIIGNFELDLDDGEIRYKTSIDVEGIGLASPLVRQAVYANVVIMDRYMNGIMRVIYGDADPAEEIGKIEGLEQSPDDLDEDPFDLSLSLDAKLRSQIEDVLQGLDDTDDEETSEDDDAEMDAPPTD